MAEYKAQTPEEHFALKRSADAAALVVAVAEERAKGAERNRSANERFYNNLALFSGGTVALSITYLGYLKTLSKPVQHQRWLIASWIAGLPEMGCRQSFTTCRKIPFQRDPHPNFKVFEVIARLWAKRDPNKPQGLAHLIKKEIDRVPKTWVFNGERVPNYFREYLQKHQPILKTAIESCWNLKPRPHPSKVPYVATTMFLETVSREQSSTLARVLSQSTGAKE